MLQEILARWFPRLGYPEGGGILLLIGNILCSILHQALKQQSNLGFKKRMCSALFYILDRNK